MSDRAMGLDDKADVAEARLRRQLAEVEAARG